MGAVCSGGSKAAGEPVAISNTNSSPALPPDASHLPHTEKAKVNIVDWKKNAFRFLSNAI